MWVACIVVPGYFLRSCANYYYGSKGGRCSFYKYIYGPINRITDPLSLLLTRSRRPRR